MADVLDNKEVKIDSPKSLFGDEFAAEPLALAEDEQDDAEDGEVDPAKPLASTGKVTRTIDLGDGSGKQVFSADTAEELLDKLTDAQIHATKKIREQAFELKRSQRAQPDRTTSYKKHEPATLTADELFKLASDIQKDPTAAIDKVIKAQAGMTLAELGAFAHDLRQQRDVNAADTAFLQNHAEDWLPTQSNASRMQEFLQKESLSYTAKNLEYAFQELKEAGLVEVRTETDPAGDGKVKVVPHNRRRPMSTGLKNSNASGRQDPIVDSKGAMSELEAEQFAKLPLDEARVFMQKIMQRAKRSSQ